MVELFQSYLVMDAKLFPSYHLTELLLLKAFDIYGPKKEITVSNDEDGTTAHNEWGCQMARNEPVFSRSHVFALAHGQQQFISSLFRGSLPLLC